MKFKNLLILPLVALFVAGCNNQPEPSPEDEGYHDDRTGVITDANGYYKDKGYTFNYEDRGNVLKNKIHNLMVDTHVTYTKYSIFKEYATYKKTAFDAETNKVTYFYTGKKVSSLTNYSREHVWPCANSNGLWDRTDSDGDGEKDTDIGEDYQGAGSDMYHIMPCTYDINSARGNKKFGEAGNKSVTKKTDGGTYPLKIVDGNRVEVADAFKGDVARIVCYLFVHYTGSFGKTNQYTGTLVLRDIVDPAEGLTIEETLAKWNKLDPVDAMEQRRNDEVQKVQGNRNPFIDHPEFVWKMFNLDD